MENVSDCEILEKFRVGDDFAIDLILSKYKTLVNSVARRYFLLGAEQEDLVQEGMIGLYKACLSYNKTSTSSFKTFAYICIKRQIQSAIKSANRQKNLFLNNALSLDSKNGVMFLRGAEIGENEKVLYLPYESSPEKDVIERENYEETIQKIKNSLSNFEFEVLRYYLDGFKCEQIAFFTAKNYKSIDNALSRIKIKLQFLNT